MLNYCTATLTKTPPTHVSAKVCNSVKKSFQYFCFVFLLPFNTFKAGAHFAEFPHSLLPLSRSHTTHPYTFKFLLRIVTYPPLSHSSSSSSPPPPRHALLVVKFATSRAAAAAAFKFKFAIISAAISHNKRKRNSPSRAHTHARTHPLGWQHWSGRFFCVCKVQGALFFDAPPGCLDDVPFRAVTVSSCGGVPCWQRLLRSDVGNTADPFPRGYRTELTPILANPGFV